MRSDQALRYIKNFMREAFLEWDRWCWQKGRIPQAVTELNYYYSRCTGSDKEQAWQEICKHARCAEKMSELLSSQGGSDRLL